MKEWMTGAQYRFENTCGEVLVAVNDTVSWDSMKGYDVVFAHSDCDWDEWKVRLPDTLLADLTDQQIFVIVQRILLPWVLGQSECLFVTSVLMSVARGLKHSREHKDRVLSARYGSPQSCFVDGLAKPDPRPKPETEK